MRTIKEEKRIKRLSKNKVNFRIFLLFCFSIIGLTVGYSALNEELKISGEASVRPIKDVRITDVRLSETTNEGQFNYNNFSVNSISLGASLPNINSTVTYEVDISNIGNVPIIINSITPEYGENSNIEYVITGIEVGKTIINTNANKTDDNMGLPTTIRVTIKYKDGVTTVPADSSASLKLTFEFQVAVDSILASSSYNETSVFKNANITSDNVKTITFKNTINVPTDIAADKVWDASLNGDNSVIAYYTTEEVNNVVWYNVVIGGYGKVQFPPNSSYLFSNYTNIETIDFGNYIDTSQVSDMSWMFGGSTTGCKSLKELNLSNFNTSNVTDMSHMFHHCDSLQSLDLSNFDTSKVSDMSWMFMFCGSLENLNINENKFITSKVTDMNRMFCGCTKLIDLNISHFDTSEVTNMDLMFNDCSSLTSLDLSNFDTSKVRSMKQMFSGCSNLASLNLSGFNTSNVTSMSRMFSDCSGLTNLDLSNFDTSKVTDMKRMFSNCLGLTSLDLSSFTNQISVDHSIITKTNSMFYGCSKLEELHLEKWNFEGDGNVTLDMTGVPETANVYIAKEQVNNYDAFVGYKCNIIGV